MNLSKYIFVHTNTFSNIYAYVAKNLAILRNVFARNYLQDLDKFLKKLT